MSNHDRDVDDFIQRAFALDRPAPEEADTVLAAARTRFENESVEDRAASVAFTGAVWRLRQRLMTPFTVRRINQCLRQLMTHPDDRIDIDRARREMQELFTGADKYADLEEYVDSYAAEFRREACERYHADLEKLDLLEVRLRPYLSRVPRQRSRGWRQRAKSLLRVKDAEAVQESIDVARRSRDESWDRLQQQCSAAAGRLKQEARLRAATSAVLGKAAVQPEQVAETVIDAQHQAENVSAKPATHRDREQGSTGGRPDSLTSRVTAGLVCVAVTIQNDTVAPDAPTKIERTVAQQQMILLLARRPEISRLTDLASLLGMTIPTAVSTSGALARDGLVQMRPSPSYAPDELRVLLTAKGHAAVPDLTSWADALLGEVENLDEATQEKVLDLVTNQIAALQRAGRIPPTRNCLSCSYFHGYAYPGTNQPHHCHLVGAPFGHRELRLRPLEDSDPTPTDILEQVQRTIAEGP